MNPNLCSVTVKVFRFDQLKFLGSEETECELESLGDAAKQLAWACSAHLWPERYNLEEAKQWETTYQERQERRRARLADLADCERSIQLDSVIGWNTYLEKHPEGECLVEARTRVDDLERRAQARDGRESEEKVIELGPRPYRGRFSVFGRLEGGMDFYHAKDGVGGTIILGVGFPAVFDFSLGYAPVSNIITLDAEFNLNGKSRWNPTLGVRTALGVISDRKLYMIEADVGMEFWIYSFWAMYFKVGIGYAFGDAKYNLRSTQGIVVPGWIGAEFRY